MAFLKLDEKGKDFKARILEAPISPGCYMYKDKSGTIIYVGKAKILRNRLKSYFANFEKLDDKTRVMVDKISDVEIITVDSEVEALILENNLIKKYKPKYNILMRDDKNYVLVRFEKIRKRNGPVPTKYSVYQDFPRITVVREKRNDGAEYFGPYPSTTPVKTILRKLGKLFPFRTSSELVYVESYSPYKIYSSNKKPSLFYHLGLSNGVEAGLESKENYVKNFKAVRDFFLGKKQNILTELENEMKEASKNLDFERAAKLRDRIEDIKYVTANIRIDNSVDDVLVKELKFKDKLEAIDNLIEALDFPKDALKNKEGFKIECYDISNIQGTNAVGSMTVLVDGELRQDLYRKFRIRMKNEPNDFAMMMEMFGRRLKRYFIENDPEQSKKYKPDASFAKLPDLVVIDGGKGQLASAYKVLVKFNLHNTIPIVGLAKREEEIYKFKDQMKDEINQIDSSDLFKKIKLSRRSESLKLLQRIRDEAHRFGITYHRNLRSKSMVR